MYLSILTIAGWVIALSSAQKMPHSRPKIRDGTSTEATTFILPIWEGALANHTSQADLPVLNTMKSLLGTGGRYTRLGWSFSSWSLSRDIQSAANDYLFDPINLKYMLGLAVEADLPILVHMNNGRWADCCTPNSDGGWGDALLDRIAAEVNTTMQNSSGVSQFGHNGGSNYFSLSRLNTVYRAYKKRNSQASATVIAAWAAANPGLFAGVSLSSETIYPNVQVDYNPIVIEEWKQWMRHTGIYGPGGDFFGAGRVPAFRDIHDFNHFTGQSFPSWSQLAPPNTIVPGNVFGEEWERWRVQMLVHAVSDETLWIAQAGIDHSLIFGHQTPRVDEYGFADSIDTITASNGASGVTYYGWNPADFGEINNPMRASGENNFGIFELNPLTTDNTTSYNTLLTLYNDGAKVICPNSWESDEAIKDQYALFASPQWGDTFGNAIRQFLLDFGHSPRNIQPTPWNPGHEISNLYDCFSTANSTGLDNHLEPTGSVGNVVRKSIFSAVEGQLTYQIQLPRVSSDQRLNFWTSVGIKDGAGVGGEVQFQATLNGMHLFGTGFHLQQGYWVWKRWVPIMVDITYWAGKTITLQLHTTGNAEFGNTMWASPAIYQSTTSNINLALNKDTAVSSEEQNADWSSQCITDGFVSGDDGVGNGWSSLPHASPSAVEWVSIDLGSPQAIGKVVLFARSDLTNAAGTGFPTAFDIQGSNDSHSWSKLIHATDYPNPKAGEGQIFAFPTATVRYVRTLASVLSGVGGEAGYRFQLAEVEVFA